jgi:hypothetical protein
VISILDEILKLLKETEKIAIQGKIRAINPHHKWRYGTIIDRTQRAILKTSELRGLGQNLLMGHP